MSGLATLLQMEHLYRRLEAERICAEGQALKAAPPVVAPASGLPDDLAAGAELEPPTFVSDIAAE